MRFLVIVVNGLVAGTGAYAYLNAETWAGSAVIVVIVSTIILWGEYLRRVAWNPYNNGHCR